MMAFFYRLSLREKFLLLFFIFALLLLWGWFQLGAYKDLRKEMKTVGQQVDYQELWLDAEDSVKDRMKDALTLMDPKKTYSRSEFIGKVDTLARNAGGAYDINNPTTKTDDVFDEHSLIVQFRSASIKDLIEFDQAIASESPYLAMKKLDLTPNVRNPYVLRAKFEVVAIELKNFKEQE